MALFTIFNQILVLFVLMGIGYGLAKKGLIDKAGSEQMTFLLCYIIMPCVILSAISQLKFDPAMFHNFLLVALLTVAMQIISIIVGHALFNKKLIVSDEKRCILRFSAIYSNCGFMGFPLLGSIIGVQGIFYGSAFNIFYGIFLWTHGFLLYTGHLDRKSILHALANPNIIVAAIGILLYYYSIKLPAPLYDVINDIGELNTALSMIVIGATMTEIPFSTLFSSLQVWSGVIARNFIFPLLILILLHLCGIQGDLLISLVILAACPTAGVVVLFAQLTKNDTVFSGKILALSTLCSLVSLPIIINLAKAL